MLSAATCTEPSVPEVVARQLRIFTFVSPRTFAMCASVPGRFSQATVSCFTLGMAGTPKSWLPGNEDDKILLSPGRGVKDGPGGGDGGRCETQIDRKAILSLGNWAKPASQDLITFGHHHSC